MLGCSWIFIVEVSYVSIHPRKWERKGEKKRFRMQSGEKTPASHSSSKLMPSAKKIQIDPDASSSKFKFLAWWPLCTNCSLTLVKTSVHLPSLNFSFFRKLLQVPKTACPDNCMQLRKPPVVDWDEMGGREAGRQGWGEGRGRGVAAYTSYRSATPSNNKWKCCCWCEAVAIWCLLKSRHRAPEAAAAASQQRRLRTWMLSCRLCWLRSISAS